MTRKCTAHTACQPYMTFNGVCRRALTIYTTGCKQTVNKTELLWCITTRCQSQLPRSALRIGTDAIIPSVVVRNLGIYIDSDLSMWSHVQQTVSGCFAVLRQLRSIWRSVPSSVLQTLVVALVLTRLDYGNATLAGLPVILLDRLQSVLNASARSIAGLCRSAHITDTVASFHERIEFKWFMFPSSPWHHAPISVRYADTRC